MLLVLLLVWGGVLNLLLMAPLWLRFGFPEGRWLAWEAWFLVAAFRLLPAHAGTRVLRWLTVVLLLVALIFGLGDAATHQILSRPLNAYFDLILISAGFHLLDGNFGRVAAMLAILVVLAMLLATAVLINRALRPAQIRRRPQPLLTGMVAGTIAGTIAGAALVLAVLEINNHRLVAQARTPAWDNLSFQFDQIRTTHAARLDFEAAAPLREPAARPLPGLADTDVLMVFIESYGESVFELARFRDIVLPRLELMAPQLEAAGLHVVSGRLEAPIRGGQSWLAHATALSGRWIDNQLWYRLLLESRRLNLIDDFSATGHSTAAVVPAIIMPWPEGRQLGFDRIFAARDLGYAGPPLNWVTMPDQYTLHHFQQVLRPALGRPLFAKIALISSHAPWTPIIEVLPDWEAVGDGAVFEPWRNAGDPPQLLWQDMERVRDHYAMSIEYALHVSLDYARRFLDENSLMILLGDHQPAALITGHDAGGGAPIHIISRRPELLEPFFQRGFVPGLVPEMERPAPAMSELRGWLHEAFGD